MSPNPVHSTVVGVSLSFYTSKELKKVSAKCITEPTSLDILGNAVPGGLYDLALGATDFKAKCVTCGLQQRDCPGHMGHIQLCLPVYNPLLFTVVLRLLRCICIYCGRFRTPKEEVDLFVKKLKLIDAGLLLEAQQFEREKRFDSYRKLHFGKLPDVDGQEEGETTVSDELRGLFDEFEMSDIPVPDEQVCTSSTTHQARERMKTVSAFLADAQKRSRCGNCKAYARTFRSDLSTKIFMLPLSARKVARMRSLHFSNLDNPLAEDTEEAKEEVMTMDVDIAGDGEDDFEHAEDDVERNDDVRQVNDGTKANGRTEEVVLPKEDISSSSQTTVSSSSTHKKGIFQSPLHVKLYFEKLFKNEADIIPLLWTVFDQDLKIADTPVPIHRKCDPGIFFLETLPVAANRFRPVNRVGDMLVEHPQNTYLSRVLTQNEKLSQSQDKSSVSQVNTWVNLQQQVNFLFDNSGASPSLQLPPGIKQILEKKQGLFRKYMMGKRVNYAARSVISPDPYIETNQIGLPLYFAKRLTYPQPVAHWNVKELRQAVINGPDVYPGATHIEDENGLLVHLPRNRDRRIGISKSLLTPSSGHAGSNVKKVYRHLKDGDVVLMNRQPTLHKPSIMGHRVRVLHLDHKTIRMHYANCKTYNADFDGDEMNCHFPQNELARSEAYNLASTHLQYVVPTSGDPLRGLIQDHICSGILLTKRDTFFEKGEFQQLVYNACSTLNTHRAIVIPSPCILSPVRLWSGKQVISTLLEQLVDGGVEMNLEQKCKVPEKMWGVNSGEGVVIIRDNEMLTGVLDKAHFGASAFGLVHSVHELYGPALAGSLLTCLGRLLTAYLQHRGFTCGLDDMLLTEPAEEFRQGKIVEAAGLGARVVRSFTEADQHRNLQAALEEKLKTDEDSAALDGKMKSATHAVTSAIINKSIPTNQVKLFPHNNLSLMTTSGAKGSTVNFSQISCLLGQQELEGKRVPRMVSGKTLPSFQAWDSDARAGGFIMDRFLTGIRPQEYYFHCMAGREGLVDTAVKTSRSGYLQRCLIKHLEGLRVHYDYTVRDSDGSVIQFRYGEDGLDVSRTKFVKK